MSETVIMGLSLTTFSACIYWFARHHISREKLSSSRFKAHRFPAVSYVAAGLCLLVGCSSESEPRSGSTPKIPGASDLWNESIPREDRIARAEKIISTIGKFHGKESFFDATLISNITYRADGTYTSYTCTTTGSPAEREFFHTTDGKWEIRKMFGPSGMVLYQVYIQAMIYPDPRVTKKPMLGPPVQIGPLLEPRLLMDGKIDFNTNGRIWPNSAGHSSCE